MQALMLLLPSSGSHGAFSSLRNWGAYKEVWGRLRIGDDDSNLGWDQRRPKEGGLPTLTCCGRTVKMLREMHLFIII
jgi:hypothetical protein